MKFLKYLGSTVFVYGFFTSVFVGIPWSVIVAKDPVIPTWLRVSLFCLIGGLLFLIFVLGLDSRKTKSTEAEDWQPEAEVLLVTSDGVPGKTIKQVYGLVQGHTVFAVWLGRDVSAFARLILGGELTEYTEMMGKARKLATNKMIKSATEKGADAIINVRYTTNSVIGSAAELLVYGTAVKLD